jgi:hypothetical protein
MLTHPARACEPPAAAARRPPRGRALHGIQGSGARRRASGPAPPAMPAVLSIDRWRRSPLPPAGTLPASGEKGARLRRRRPIPPSSGVAKPWVTALFSPFHGGEGPGRGMRGQRRGSKGKGLRLQPWAASAPSRSAQVLRVARQPHRLQPRRPAGHDADRPPRQAERHGEELFQRGIGRAFLRRRAHPRLEVGAPVGRVLHALERILPAARRHPHEESSPSLAGRKNMGVRSAPGRWW